MDFFDSIFEQTACENFRELPLYQSLYVSEEQAFQALAEITEPLSLRDSARCLHKAMQDCSVELFRQILANSQLGECAEMAHMPACETAGWGIRARGSLVTLAAMLDRPRQAALLLEHGYNVNSSGLAMADYLRSDGKQWSNVAPSNVLFCASAGCEINVIRPQRSNVTIACVTPLAAALLCGSLQTAEVLLSRHDVWKGESSAVCRAAALVLEGIARPALSEDRQQNQLEILRQIFCPKQTTLPSREAFLRSVYLQPASFVDICSTKTLQYQLESGLCTEGDARQMLQILNVDHWWWRGEGKEHNKAGKLLLLKKHFPHVCREGWVTGIFLREAVRRIREKMPYKTLLTAWKQLCGKERDLTWLGNNIWAMNWRELNLFLKEAEKDGSLIMDADALGNWHCASYRCISEILKHIRFRQRPGEGASGLMQHLLMSGDLRLLRTAVKMGLLKRENPQKLLECLQNYDQRQDMRALVLTYAQNIQCEPTALADWQEPRRWQNWCSWEMLQEEDAQTLVRQLLHQKQTREECLRTIFRLHAYMERGVFAPDVAVEHPEYPMMETDSLAGFACCAESGQALKLMIELWPEKLHPLVRANWSKKFFFCGSPLTLAAAMGRTEQVQILLDAGIDADEMGRGDGSRFFVRNADYSEIGFPVTPVLAAILFGQEEIARMLLQHGASCDFTRPEHLRVLMQGSAKSLRLAESLSNVGVENISAENLKAMRIMTSAHGERTRFWESLQHEPVCREFSNCI